MENALKIFTVIIIIIIMGVAITQLPAQTDNFVGSPSDVGEASYIIYKDGDYTCAKNGTTGRIEQRAANSTYVIQSALDSLADGGSVYVRTGDYELNWTVYILNDGITLFGDGVSTSFTMGDDLNRPMIQAGNGTNKAAGAEISNIIIRDISVNGNSANNMVTSGIDAPYGIYFNNVNEGAITNCKCVDLYSDGIIVSYYSHDISVSGNYVYMAAAGVTVDRWSYQVSVTNNVLDHSRYENGITLFNVVDVTVVGNSCEEIFAETTNHTVIANNVIRRTGTLSDNGITFCSMSRGLVIQGNSIYNVNLLGINVTGYAPDGTPHYLSDVLIDGNLIVGNARTQTGIKVLHAYQGVVISNNIIERVTVNGIYTDGSAQIIGNSINFTAKASIVVNGPNSIISNNKIVNPSNWNAGVYSGIELNGTCQRSVVEGNQIYSAANYPKYSIEEAGSAWQNTISNNVLVGFGTSAIHAVSNTTIKDNIGFVTENYGTATIASGGTTKVVTHGLSATPIIVVVTGNTTDTAAIWITNITSTQFTINVGSAVGGDRTVYWYAAAW